MEYVQEYITTLHDFGDAPPSVPSTDTTIVVPMTEGDYRGLAVENVFRTLEKIAPDRVIVPLQAASENVSVIFEWLTSFELDCTVLWCDSPALNAALESEGIDGARGKGRDVWLGLGLACDSEYVVVHDADAQSYTAEHVQKLLFPVTNGYVLSKGYYARVEHDQLYGRLFRLFYEPLIETIRQEQTAPILRYLSAFRYALSGEFAITGSMAENLRVHPGWGLEIGTLGDVYRLTGKDNVAQVDLGVHEHDHRSVTGPEGLADMASQVCAALCHVLEENGINPAYETLPDRYQQAAESYIESYALDAAFNGLQYDRANERAQVRAYADAISAPGKDNRLPAWEEMQLLPEKLQERADDDLMTHT